MDLFGIKDNGNVILLRRAQWAKICKILLLCGSFNIDFPARGLGALHFYPRLYVRTTRV
jgi:hypothetical protein